MTFRKIKELVYIACPYASHDPQLRAGRVLVASMAAADVAQSAKQVPFSPLTHGDTMRQFLPDGVARDHHFWMDMDITFLAACDLLLVLPLQGWRLSEGVKEEIEFATRCRTPIKFWRDSRLLDRLPKYADTVASKLVLELPDLAERQAKGWKLWN